MRFKTTIRGNDWDTYLGQCWHPDCRRDDQGRQGSGKVIVRGAATYAAARMALNEHKATDHGEPIPARAERADRSKA